MRSPSSLPVHESFVVFDGGVVHRLQHLHTIDSYFMRTNAKRLIEDLPPSLAPSIQRWMTMTDTDYLNRPILLRWIITPEIETRVSMTWDDMHHHGGLITGRTVDTSRVTGWSISFPVDDDTAIMFELDELDAAIEECSLLNAMEGM